MSLLKKYLPITESFRQRQLKLHDMPDPQLPIGMLNNQYTITVRKQV